MNSTNGRTVTIELFSDSTPDYGDDHAVIAIDVIRATTTAVTCVALGRKCFPVPSVEQAFTLASKLCNPLLVGEVGGDMPEGFHLQNSPLLLERRTDIERPMVLLSTSGTRLIDKFKRHRALYLACLRNMAAISRHLMVHHRKVALIGAGSRGEFREEDQLCCAWIAETLIDHGGYAAGDAATSQIVQRWRGAPVDSICTGNSAAYLRRSGQLGDLNFILNHLDDLDAVYRATDAQVVQEKRRSPRPLRILSAFG